jgi:transcriptional regulator with XRE-family HTH domain
MKALCDDKSREISAHIRKIRESRNYTQDYLAAKLNMSQNAYSKIELGLSNINLSRLMRIAEILEVDVVDIIKPPVQLMAV